MERAKGIEPPRVGAQNKKKTRVCEVEWSGRRESNPRMQLGKLPFYH